VTGTPGVVVGLAAEARLLPDPAAARCAAGDARRAEALARTLAAAGAPALVSFGMAGGLDLALSPGAIVLADAVILPDGAAIATDAEWRARARRLLGSESPLTEAPILGSDAVLLGPDAKADQTRRTGAAAVDMESHGVARAAAALGLPLLVLRAIADPASARLPSIVAHAMRPDGRVRASAVIAAALSAPGEIADLVRLARFALAARRSLRRAVDRLGPRLGRG
jgi:adenosylhomocysteine nucleosidase